MYAVTDCAKGDCYLCVPPDPGIEAAALGASESAAPGTSESAAPGTCESAAPGAGEFALSGTAPTKDLHTFTLDSGASRSFRDITTLTLLSRPVAVSLVDPSGGPVLAHSSTVLLCPAAPSGLLSGLYPSSFSTNLVSGADLQDARVDQFTPGAQRVTHCTCSRTGRHLATFTRRPGSSLYTLTTASPPVPASGMASRTLVSALPRSLPPLPPGPAPTCVPCAEGRQRDAPHSSKFPPIEAPLQTLHMDVWGPARVRGQSHERYFPLVVDDYLRYTTIFPLRCKGEVTEVLIDWIRDRGGEFSSDLLRAFYRAEGIRQTFTLPASPQHNGIAERRIAMVMDVARTSMIHAAAPHFLWPFAVQYAAHQINLQPLVSLQETTPTLRWTGKVGDTSDITFDESVSYYRLFPYRTVPLPPLPLFLAPGAPPLDPLPPQGPAPSGCGALGAEPRGAESGGAEPGGAEPERAESGGPPGVPSRREPLSPQQLREWYARRCRRAAGASGPVAGGASGAGAAVGAAGAAATGGASGAAGGAAGAGAAGAAGAGGTGTVGGPAGVGAAGGAGAAGPGGARTRGTGAARAGGAAGVGAVGAVAVTTGGADGAGAVGGTGAGSAVGVVVGDPRAEGTGAVSAVSGGAARPRPYYVPLLQQVLGLPPSTGPTPPLLSPPIVQSTSQLQPASPLPGPSPYSGPTRGLTERREPESRPASRESRLASPESRFESLVRPVRTGRRVPLQCPPVPGTHSMTLRPSTAPQRVPLPSPPVSSFPALADMESDSLCTTTRTVTRLLATVVTDPSFESTAASALVAELVDFAAHCRLDYAASLVAESESASVCPPSVGGECALGLDVLEDRHEEFECFATAVPHLVSMLLAPEGDPDAPDIPTPRSYVEAIEGPYSSQWQASINAEMASWKSTGTYVNEVPLPGANIGVDFFQTFSPTPKMTTLRVLLHVAAQRDYKLHSLDFSTAFLQGSLHEEIWLRRPPGFTGTFPAGT
ncbi:unnamed protein product [Closterium sp. NIES-54]